MEDKSILESKNKYMKNCHLMVYLNDNLGDDLFVKIISARYPYMKFITISNSNIKLKLDNVKVLKGFWYKNANKLIKMLSNRKETVETLLEKKYKRSLFIGGSMFIEGQSSNKELSCHKGDYYIIGINFGPYKTEKYFNECKNIFKNSKYVCFRDKTSYNLFKDLGENIDVAPDFVFNLDTNNITITDRKRVVFSIIDCKNKLDEKYEEIYDKTIINLTKLLIEKGYEITYMSFCKNQNDEVAIKRIISKCDENIKNKIDTYFYDGNIEDALNVLGDCKLIVGSRFHANIIGLLLGKTVIPVIYSEKTINTLKDMNFKGKIIDIKKMDDFDFNSITEEDLNYHLDISKKIEEAKRPLKVIDKLFNYDGIGELNGNK